jgi:hypothetical protein
MIAKVQISAIQNPKKLLAKFFFYQLNIRVVKLPHNSRKSIIFHQLFKGVILPFLDGISN